MATTDQLFAAIEAGDANLLEAIVLEHPGLASAERDGVPAVRLAAYVGHPLADAIPMQAPRGMMEAAVPLEPGQQTVGFSVTVIWELT